MKTEQKMNVTWIEWSVGRNGIHHVSNDCDIVSVSSTNIDYCLHIHTEMPNNISIEKIEKRFINRTTTTTKKNVGWDFSCGQQVIKLCEWERVCIYGTKHKIRNKSDAKQIDTVSSSILRLECVFFSLNL